MATHFSEVTTRAALAEKKKLCKGFRRIDMMCYTVVAIIGLNALGAIAANGAQALTWLVISAGALPHGNLPLFVSHSLFPPSFRRRCHEATSVPMTSGQTSTQALYS